MKRQPDTGESAAAIIRRSEDLVWPRVEAALRDGATLVRYPGLNRFYVDAGQGPSFGGITDAGVRRLENAGTLQRVGADRYALSDSVQAEARVTITTEVVGQQLVARIKRGSKYWGQTSPNQWFDVRVVADTYYQLRGNNNNYRLSDVAIGVRLIDGIIFDLTNGKTSSANNRMGVA